MKLLDELEKFFEAKLDQDGDGDQDFADVMMARMKASGMSDKEAKAKVKDKEYNEAIVDEATAMEKQKEFYDSLSPAEKRRFQRKPYEFGPFYDDEVKEGHIRGHDDEDSELKEETAEEKRKKFYDSLSPAEKRRFQRKPYEFGPFYDDEVNEGDIDEMSTTAGVPGYQTPMAFQSKPKSAKDKEKEDDTVMQGGMKKAKKTNKYFKPMENKSTYKKMMAEMYGVVNEVSYRDYKKDPTSTPQQKVNRGIMEVNKMLAEMEKIVANNLRLKTEMGVDSSHFWKATGKRFSRINERMIRIANRLKELSQ